MTVTLLLQGPAAAALAVPPMVAVMVVAMPLAVALRVLAAAACPAATALLGPGEAGRLAGLEEALAGAAGPAQTSAAVRGHQIPVSQHVALLAFAPLGAEALGITC